MSARSKRILAHQHQRLLSLKRRLTSAGAFVLGRMSERSTATRLLLLGAACLVVVLLTHVAEALHTFAFMGWGQPDSAGHYLDLASAVLGGALLVAGLLAAILYPRKNIPR